MKELRKRLAILLIPLLLAGCTHDMNRKEIDEINFIRVMGIDFIDGQYLISALYSISTGADPESGSGGDKEEITEGRGQTPYQAFEDIRMKNKKTISVANIGYFLIGEKAAEQGIDICLDFLSRDQTIKMDSLVFVTKDESAKDFLKDAIEEKQTVNEDLEAVEQKQSQLVTRNDNTLVNLLNEMKQTRSSLLIPYLVAENKSFLIQGYTVFDRLKLKDYLDYETSSGIDFVKNIIRSYPIYLEEKVGLELSVSSTKLKTKLKDENVSVRIQIDFETMIREIIGDQNVFTRDGLEELTSRQNEKIRKIVQKAVDYSVENGLDIMQVARLIENDHVNEWGSIEKDWDNIISRIDYEIITRSKISKSFVLGNTK